MEKKRNLWVIPTEHTSRLYYNSQERTYQLCEFPKYHTDIKSTRNLYITSDEEIKKGDWYSHKQINYLRVSNSTAIPMDAKKVILTTDQDLIKDGVQAIDDEFLQWFIKNPSCEEVEIVEGDFINGKYTFGKYRIGKMYYADEPKEEPKQETLEEASKKYSIGKSSSSVFQEAPKKELKDTIVESVINQFKQRSKVGIEKYGVTMDRTDLTRLEWLQHAQEEAMDLILYLEKLKNEIK
jgi:hypothetical protein